MPTFPFYHPVILEYLLNAAWVWEVPHPWPLLQLEKLRHSSTVTCRWRELAAREQGCRPQHSGCRPPLHLPTGLMLLHPSLFLPSPSLCWRLHPPVCSHTIHPSTPLKGAQSLLSLAPMTTKPASSAASWLLSNTFMVDWKEGGFQVRLLLAYRDIYTFCTCMSLDAQWRSYSFPKTVGKTSLLWKMLHRHNFSTGNKKC